MQAKLPNWPAMPILKAVAKLMAQVFKKSAFPSRRTSKALGKDSITGLQIYLKSIHALMGASGDRELPSREALLNLANTALAQPAQRDKAWQLHVRQLDSSSWRRTWPGAIAGRFSKVYQAAFAPCNVIVGHHDKYFIFAVL